MSKRGTRTSFAPFDTPKFMASVPNEWKNGRQTRQPPSPGRTTESQALACIALATRLRWLSMAPFDSPVVPPV